MRLLNVYNLSFATFNEGEVPPYAIASHRWGEEEVTYAEVGEKKNEWKKGFKKIRGFCHLTRTRNNLVESTLQPKVRPACGNPASGRAVRVDWIWIDTCCIDGTSSADVAENITSMYRYYERAEECYAYLADVKIHGELNESSWFTRGWTLQELIAPRFVFFLSRGWKVLGHKCGYSHQLNLASYECGWGERPLVSEVSKATGISLGVLKKRITLSDRDTVVRWMRYRETTKIEDMAYCLLGLLRVSMPSNYGEGLHAWTRLEFEVSKKKYASIGHADVPIQVRRARSPHEVVSTGITETPVSEPPADLFAETYGSTPFASRLGIRDQTKVWNWYSSGESKGPADGSHIEERRTGGQKGTSRASHTGHAIESSETASTNSKSVRQGTYWRDEFLAKIGKGQQNGSSYGDKAPRARLEDTSVPGPLPLLYNDNLEERVQIGFDERRDPPLIGIRSSLRRAGVSSPVRNEDAAPSFED